MANGAAPNQGCIKDNRKHSSVDQLTNDGGVEAPQCVHATVNKARSGKALLSNHKDVPPPSELGVNPNAQIAYMGTQVKDVP